MRIDFPELHDGAFVEIKDPKKLTWKEQKNITKAFTNESMEAQMEVAERIALALIKSGYLLDDENRPVTFPLTDETVQNLPAMVVETVTTKFAELKNSKN